MKHLQLFESYGEKKYLFVDMTNGDGYSDPTIKLYDSKKEAQEEFVNIMNNQEDAKYVKEISHNEGKWDMTFLLGYNYWKEYLSDESYTWKDFDGDSYRMIINEIELDKYYVVELIYNVLEYNLYTFETFEEAENFYNSVENEIEEDGDEDVKHIVLIEEGIIKNKN